MMAKLLDSCVICRKLREWTLTQLMANLPPERRRPALPSQMLALMCLVPGKYPPESQFQTLGFALCLFGLLGHTYRSVRGHGCQLLHLCATSFLCYSPPDGETQVCSRNQLYGRKIPTRRSLGDETSTSPKICT